MGTEENYLDNLLKSITKPEPDAVEDIAAEEPVPEQIPEIKEEEIVRDEQMDEEIKLIPEPEETEDTLELPEELEIADVLEELNIADIPDVLEVPEELDIAEMPEIPEELDIADISEELELPELSEELEGSDISTQADVLEMTDMPTEPEIADVLEKTEISEISKEPEELEIADTPEELEMPELLEVPDELEVPKVTDMLEEFESGDAPEQSVTEDGALGTAFDFENLQEAETSETIDVLEALELPEEFDISELSDISEHDEEENEPQVETAKQVLDESDVDVGLDIGDLEIPEVPDIELAEETDHVLDISDTGDLNMPELLSDETEVQIADELSNNGLEMGEDSQSETEFEMSDELNLEELDLDTSELETLNTDDDLGILGSMDEDIKDNGVSGVDDGLDDVLSMLDDDADLAEINDILKKSDSNEPIQDEMMDLLNQMADDEAALVNAGVKNIEEDGGVPIPDMTSVTGRADDDSEEQASSKKKKKSGDGEKKPGAIGKLFNLLTEELPGPTEADYAAEEEKKAAKKQEALTKKEEEKLAKEEEKQAKAAEKEAAKKAKAEVAAQKKKEKDEAKAKKAAEKQAKQAAGAGKRAKRIPPKKIAAVAVFGASVFGGVIVATNVLSNQGYINVAKKAFYDGNYKEVYLATYGMNLQDSDALVAKKSEVILKMQRWYDSYQNNLKLGREREALDALVRSFESYDYINAEAEEYGVLSEVDSIKGTILGVLQSQYGLSEEQARALLDYEDALEYTVALNNIITGK